MPVPMEEITGIWSLSHSQTMEICAGTSSMASIIGVNELMFAGKVVVGSTYLGLEPYIVAAGFYFIMTFTLGRIISLIERRMKKSDSR